jgi:hypothetical protein
MATLSGIEIEKGSEPGEVRTAHCKTRPRARLHFPVFPAANPPFPQEFPIFVSVLYPVIEPSFF